MKHWEGERFIFYDHMCACLFRCLFRVNTKWYGTIWFVCISLPLEYLSFRRPSFGHQTSLLQLLPLKHFANVNQSLPECSFIGFLICLVVSRTQINMANNNKIYSRIYFSFKISQKLSIVDTLPYSFLPFNKPIRSLP